MYLCTNTICKNVLNMFWFKKKKQNKNNKKTASVLFSAANSQYTRGLELFTTEHEGSDGHRTWQTRMETSYFNLIITIGLTGEQEETVSNHEQIIPISRLLKSMLTVLTNVTANQRPAVLCTRWHQRQRQLARYHTVNVGKWNLRNCEQSCADAVNGIVLNSEYNIGWLVQMSQR